MEHRRVGRKARLLTLKKKEDEKNVRREYVSELYDGTERGYSSNDVKIIIHANGAIYLSGEEHGGVYLYPEQVKHLKKILRVK